AVRRADLHHVVEARIVAIAPLGEADVGALAAVTRNDVADDHRVVVGSAADHGLELRFGAERRVYLAADAVEVAVNGGRVLAPAEAARQLHGPGMHALDADLAEDAPELGVAHALQHRFARARDLRRRVGGEPHRGQGRRGAWLRLRIGMPPLLAGARVAPGRQIAPGEHRRLPPPLG